MRKNILLILFIGFIITNSFATVRTITVQNFSFSPNNVNALVGDTIVWTWVSGSHTTTSTNIPLGATAWDHNLNSTSPSFTYIINIQGTYNYKCTPHASMGMTGIINAQPISISQIGTTVNSFELKQNYPNPFNPTTNINFSIPKSEFVKISIFNTLGKEVATLTEGRLESGSYNVKFEGTNYSSGVYFYKISAGEFSSIKRMLLIK